MEIILREDIKGLGYKNDIVKVKAGYGRNYLIPRGVAILASKSNRKMIDENIRQAAHKAEKSLKNWIWEGLGLHLGGVWERLWRLLDALGPFLAKFWAFKSQLF